MNRSYKIALRVYKYSAILATLIYCIYMVIDDYVFIEKYWDEHWLQYLGIWGLYFLVYFVIFSLYFGLASMAVILIYHKVIKRYSSKNA